MIIWEQIEEKESQKQIQIKEINSVFANFNFLLLHSQNEEILPCIYVKCNTICDITIRWKYVNLNESKIDFIDEELELKEERAKKEHELAKKKKEYELTLRIQGEEEEYRLKLKDIAKKNEQAQRELFANQKAISEQKCKQLQEEQQKRVKLYQDENEKLKIMNEKLRQKRKQITANIKANEEDIAKILQDVKDADQKISEAIERTNVDDGTIPIFLRFLNDGLLFATPANAQRRELLCQRRKVLFQQLKQFSVDRPSWRVTIQYQFSQSGLEKYIPALTDNDYTYMDDLLCDNAEEFKIDFIDDVWGEMEVKGRDLRALKKLLLRYAAFITLLLYCS